MFSSLRRLELSPRAASAFFLARSAFIGFNGDVDNDDDDEDDDEEEDEDDDDDNDDDKDD